MRSHRGWLLSGPVILALALALALPPAVAAAPPSTWAWVVARQPTTASYTPAGKDQGNSSGGTNTVERAGTGSYTVTMPGVVNASDGGDVQVSALGAARYCTVTEWGGTTQIDVTVHCHTLNGTMADSAFSVMFLTRGSSSPIGSIAYAWADQESASDYTPADTYQWPGTITIHRSSAGHYEVRLPGFDGGHLDIQVTGYGDAFCMVTGSSFDENAAYVDVLCPAGDSEFDLLYLDGVGPTGVMRPKAAYALVVPLDVHFPSYRRYSSVSKTPKFTRSAVGQYIVTLPGMPKGGMALVTAIDGLDVICYLNSIRTSATPQKVGIKCAHPNGTAADADFFLAYTK